MSVASVKVWNDDHRPYSEKFNDDMVTIPAKHYVVMEKPDADRFLGQFTPIKRTGTGEDLYPKRLRMELIDSGDVLNRAQYTCMACNRQHLSDKELDAHTAEYHLDQMVDEDAKKDLKKRVGKA